MQFTQWNGFQQGNWQEGIDVRNFIQTNYRPFSQEPDFLQGPTARTQALMDKVQELFRQERQKGGKDGSERGAMFHKGLQNLCISGS